MEQSKKKVVFMCNLGGRSSMMADAFRQYLQKTGQQEKFQVYFSALGGLDPKNKIEKDTIVISPEGYEKYVAQNVRARFIKTDNIFFVPYRSLPEGSSEAGWETVKEWGNRIVEKLEIEQTAKKQNRMKAMAVTRVTSLINHVKRLFRRRG